jgi:hypothetical protein
MICGRYICSTLALVLDHRTGPMHGSQYLKQQAWCKVAAVPAACKAPWREDPTLVVLRVFGRVAVCGRGSGTNLLPVATLIL